MDTQTPDPAGVATEPEAASLKVAEPEPADLGAAQPGTAEPGTAEPRVPEPRAAEPRAAEAVTAQPVAVVPVAAEPVAGLVAAGPVQASPEAVEPVVTEQAADATGPDREESALAVVDPVAELAEPESAGRPDEVRAVRPLAVAAYIAGIIALIGAAAAVLAVVTHGFRPKTVVTYRPAAVFSLRAGDCLNSSPNGLSVSVRSCATPHDAEVFATFSLTGSSWPGSAVVRQEAGSGCMSRLAGYLSPAYANAGFAEEYIYPNQAAWQAGVRTVVCEVRAPSGQLTGSVGEGG